MQKGDAEYTKQFDAFRTHYLPPPDSLLLAKVEEMGKLSVKDLPKTIAAIQGTGDRLQEADAFRAAATAVHFGKLTDSLIEHLDRLDESNKKLTKVGWLLALVGILVAVIDVLVELHVFG